MTPQQILKLVNLKNTLIAIKIAKHRAYRVDYGLNVSFYGLNTTLVLSKIRS